jgi:hypothetical protein
VRIDDWTIPTYGLAVCLVLALLLGGQSSAAHAAALAPFAVLVSAVAGAGRRPGRVLAILGLIATAALVVAFTSSVADWYADGSLVLGVILLIAALLRSGAAIQMRGHRKPLAIIIGSFIGFVMFWSAVGLATTLPAALHPQVGCVDTCWGDALGAFFAGLFLAETILLTLIFVALFVSPMTGLGALIMAVGLNLCFFLAPPTATATYAVGVITWYLGLFILAQPWTRTHPATVIPAP